jgi:diguanylate cyclase (GGDEF)-like protein
LSPWIALRRKAIGAMAGGWDQIRSARGCRGPNSRSDPSSPPRQARQDTEFYVVSVSTSQNRRWRSANSFTLHGISSHADSENIDPSIHLAQATSATHSLHTRSRRIVILCIISAIAILGIAIGLLSEFKKQALGHGEHERHSYEAALELEINIYEHLDAVRAVLTDAVRSQTVAEDSKTDIESAFELLSQDLSETELSVLRAILNELYVVGKGFTVQATSVASHTEHLYQDFNLAARNLTTAGTGASNQHQQETRVTAQSLVLHAAATLALLGRAGVDNTDAVQADIAALERHATLLESSNSLPQAVLLREIAGDLKFISAGFANLASLDQRLSALAVRSDTLLDDRIQRRLQEEAVRLSVKATGYTKFMVASGCLVFIALIAGAITLSRVGARASSEASLLAESISTLGVRPAITSRNFEFDEYRALHEVVSRQDRALREARMDRTRFSDLLDDIGELRLIVDANGRVLEATIQATAFLAVDDNESLVGQELHSILGPAFDIDALWSLTVSGIVQQFQWRGILRTGQIVSLWMMGLRLLTDESEGDQLMLVLHQEGFDDNQPQRQIGALVVEGLLLLNSERQILATNTRVCEILGRPEAEVVGATLRSLLPGLTSGESVETQGTRPDGTEFAVSVSIHSIARPGDASVYLATIEDITIRKAATDVIERLAYVDALTGLPNRTTFHNQLEHSLGRADRCGEKLALLYLDLNNFKDVNDSLGHLQGDELLRVIGRRLQDIVRKSEFAARLGGDEFSIILDVGTSASEAYMFAVRIHEAISDPVELDDRVLRPTVSIGIAVYPDDAHDSTSLLRAADSAMYSAKRQREVNPRIACYEQHLTAEAEQRLELDHDLRNAISGAQFVLHYQPLLEVETRRVKGVEALIRWQHPTRGLLYPGTFIPVAESIGIIEAMGAWVLNEACRQAVAWRREGLDLKMSVNVSPTQLKSSEFLDCLREAIATSGIEPHRLEIEVTESGIQDTDEVRHALTAISDMDVRIALDDFGTGYSSLSSLRKMPIDCLKIDRAFLSDIIEEANGNLFLGTIVGLARSLGMETVAEGVETWDQYAIAQDLSVDYAQGYLFSRPVPPDQIRALVVAGVTQPPAIKRLA